MKKHWYDYLWIASLLYLLLGFFNILFAWLGLLCFFIPLIISVVSGTKSYCNRYCGPGPAVWAAGRALRAVPQERHPQMDEKQGVPIRISRLFLRHVLSDAVEHLFGVRRCAGSGAGGHPAVDLQAALELGLPRHPFPSRRGAVRLRLLRRHAHIHSLGANHHGAVQAPQLVCLLPHGHHDTADLQSKEQPHMTVPYHAAQSCNCRSLSSSRSRTMPRESRTMPSL